MYGFLVTACALYLIVGLIKPGWAMPAAWRPNRWKVLGAWFLLSVAFSPLAPEPTPEEIAAAEQRAAEQAEARAQKEAEKAKDRLAFDLKSQG